MDKKSLIGATALGASLAATVERRARKDSMLHRRAEQFEKGQINSFAIVTVDPLGQVSVDFDAGAAGEGSEMDLAAAFGKLAAGMVTGHDHLMNQVAEMSTRLLAPEKH